MDDEVANRRGGQIQLQRLPLAAVVERYKHSLFRPRVKEAAPRGIFANHVDVTALGNSRGDLLPRKSGVLRFVNVGLDVVEPVAIDRSVGFVLVEVRRVDKSDFAPR